MSDAELDTLLEETKRLRIGNGWLAEIRSACVEVSRHFSPAAYAVSERSWTASEIDELVQDVTTGQLLGDGQLDYILDVSASIHHVRRLLRHQVRRALVKRRRLTVVDRLLARLRAMLDGPRFERLPGLAPSRYRPMGSSLGGEPPTEGQIRKAAAMVRLLPTTTTTGDRAPTVFRSEVLEQVLNLSFEATETSLSIDDFGKVLREALTSWVPVVLEMNDEADRWPVEMTELPFELEETLNALMQQLSDTDRLILRSKLAGLSDAAVAADLGVSRPTAVKRRLEAFRRLRSSWTDLAGDLSVEQSGRLAQEIYLRLNQGRSGR